MPKSERAVLNIDDDPEQDGLPWKLRLPPLADLLPIGIFTCDSEGRILQYNQHCASYWGREPNLDARFMGTRAIYHTSGLIVLPLETPMAKALTTGQAIAEQALTIERPDSSRINVIVNAEPVFEAGVLIGGVCTLQSTTGKKSADPNLTGERDLLAAIVETTPACIMVIGRDGNLLQINAAGLRMIGVNDVSEGLDRQITDIIADEYRDTWIANHHRICNGEKLTWEFDITAHSGERRSLETHATPIELPDGSRAQLAIIRDVTQRKQNDEQIQESEYRYRQLLEALPAAVYTTDADGRITYFNQAAVDFSGRLPELGSDEWCVSWRLYEVDGTPLRHDECPMAVALKEQRTVIGAEAIAERPDGSRARFLPYPTPIFDKRGRMTGAINMLVDITARHHDKLEAARLAAIVSSSDDAIVGKTLRGIVTSWNTGAERIFGYTEQEMVGRHISKIIPRELWPEEEEILAKLSRGEHIDHFETIRVAKDGRRIDVSVTVSPIRDGSGRLIGASKVGRDITERKHAQKIQELLIGELNHRVKNTLATVQSIANQTLYRSKSPGDFAASFGGRLQGLSRTHNLLTATTWRGAELSEIIRDQLLIDCTEDDRISFSGSSVMLSPQAALHTGLVLHELATNAHKHGALSTPRGRLSLRWIIRTEESERKLYLEWKEHGGPAVTPPETCGFGSTLIEKSLDAHGGTTSIRYEPDGLACEIVLPLKESEYPPFEFISNAHPAMEPRKPRENATHGTGIKGKRILVVDDEPLIAMDIATSLADDGCIVLGPASTAEKAMALIETTEIDAALLDANLAGDPVDALAGALTERNVPFAFVSGYGREGLPKAFQKVALIKKPFQRAHLAEIVQQLTAEPAVAVSLATPQAPVQSSGTQSSRR